MNKQEWLHFGGAVLMVAAILFIGFPVIEPVITRGAATSTQFTVTQEVTSEISFAEEPVDVTMSPALGGISGGNSYGSTTVRVTTNDSAGFNMTLIASSTASGHALQGNSQGGYIPDYRVTATSVPSYSFSVAANRAAFGYTVTASTTADLAQQFLDNGSTLCNIAGGTDTSSGTCWADASTTARTIINRSTETTASGATSTIAFRVTINTNPVPDIPEDFYVATMTLTATTN